MEEKSTKYEMMIPRGVHGQILAKLLEEYPEITIKQSDDGPYLLGEKEKLEEARDYIVKALNDRIQQLSGT
ncbi:MAG TPA: hypothetical protein PLC38_08845 [Methanobacterium sp.]|jgi:hypothetical protein|nr:MAG: hypothetical protein FGO69_07875 [Methanobacterium sp.]HOI72373.1 hypothetical protein [Methanobacterium sp.]